MCLSTSVLLTHTLHPDTDEIFFANPMPSSHHFVYATVIAQVCLCPCCATFHFKTLQSITDHTWKVADLMLESVQSRRKCLTVDVVAAQFPRAHLTSHVLPARLLGLLFSSTAWPGTMGSISYVITAVQVSHFHCVCGLYENHREVETQFPFVIIGSCFCCLLHRQPP